MLTAEVVVLFVLESLRYLADLSVAKVLDFFFQKLLGLFLLQAEEGGGGGGGEEEGEEKQKGKWGDCIVSGYSNRTDRQTDKRSRYLKKWSGLPADIEDWIRLLIRLLIRLPIAKDLGQHSARE